ncbi:MAG: hypothetical protein VX646_00220 [Verrucomicrobiota bacterium]|nr:hypothetical protein [Verrucomicrobiota bacterium]
MSRLLSGAYRFIFLISLHLGEGSLFVSGLCHEDPAIQADLSEVA